MSINPPSLNPANQEVVRRRTFAIISHPDAGKTTLTEKFLLYGGAPPYKRNFSVSVVLPASGCEIMAKVLLRTTS